MYHFYASNVGENDWQEDILGRSVLEPGESVDVRIDDGSGYCRYDLKAVFTGGRYATRYGLNVCTAERWTVYGD